MSHEKTLNVQLYIWMACGEAKKEKRDVFHFIVELFMHNAGNARCEDRFSCFSYDRISYVLSHLRSV